MIASIKPKLSTRGPNTNELNNRSRIIAPKLANIYGG
jgi:hypothetical protein